MIVCHTYNHSVYAGIWCSICKPTYTTALYKRAYVLNFESGYVFYSKSSYVFWHGWVGFVSPRIQRDCISGYVLDFDLICFISESSYVFFPKDDMFLLEDVCPKWKVNWATYTVIMYTWVCYVFILKSGYVFLRTLYVFLESLICFFRKFYMFFLESVPCFFQKVLYVFFPESFIYFFGKF